MVNRSWLFLGWGSWLLGFHALGGVTKGGSISDEQYVQSMAAEGKASSLLLLPLKKGVGVCRVFCSVGLGGRRDRPDMWESSTLILSTHLVPEGTAGLGLQRLGFPTPSLGTFLRF